MAHSAKFGIDIFLAVMVALQIAPRTRTNWLRPVGTNAKKTMLAAPKEFNTSKVRHYLHYFFLGGGKVVVTALGSLGDMLCCSKSSSKDGAPLGCHLFLAKLLK